MVKVKVMMDNNTYQEYYMDGYLKPNLDTAKTQIKKDWDMMFVIDGEEGTGKSVLAQQIGMYCDPTLCLDRVCFDHISFLNAVNDAKPYQCVILDEAYGSLSSRAAMSVINKTMIQIMTVMRERNLFIILVLPSFFDLDKYAAIWRSRILINVYADKFERGRFNYFGKKQKKLIYLLGKKYYSYKVPGVRYPVFRGAFTNYYTLDEVEYRKKKTKYGMMNTIFNKKESELSEKEIIRNFCIDRSYDAHIHKGITQKNLSIVFDVHTETIRSWIKKKKKEMKEVDNGK